LIGSWINPIAHPFTKSPGYDDATHAYGEKYKATVNGKDGTKHTYWYQNGGATAGTIESATYTACKCVAKCTGKLIVGEIVSNTAVQILKGLAKKYAAAATGAGIISTVYSGFDWITCSVECSNGCSWIEA
jgi:hypothetical protein